MFFSIIFKPYETGQYIIRGMKHYDYEEDHPTATFDGDRDFQATNRVDFTLTSAFSHGMSSTFYFYGEHL